MASYGHDYVIPDLKSPLTSKIIDDRVEKHEKAVAEINYYGNSGYSLLEEVEINFPTSTEKIDKRLPRVRKQILTERVLLLGVKYLIDREESSPPVFHFNWRTADSHYGIRAKVSDKTLRGVALFDTSPQLDARLKVINAALTALDEADLEENRDIKLVMINLDDLGAVGPSKLKDNGFSPIASSSAGASFTLHAKQYVLFVNIHTDECWLFGK